MREPSRWRRYLRLWGPDRRADVDDELTFHLESRVEDLVREGLTEAEARARARREFGDEGRIRAQLLGLARRQERKRRRSRTLADLDKDLRLGLRQLRREPVFAAAALLTLAVGIGANSAMFGVAHAVLLRPLPYDAPDRLMVLWEHNLPRSRPTNVVAPANYLDWRERSRSFQELAVLVPASVTLTGADDAERLYGAQVSPSVFGMLGVAPALGRTLGPEDVEGGDAAAVVVLSHGFWTRVLGGDPGVVGRTVSLGGDPYLVVGVMPPGFQTPTVGWLGPQDFWAPIEIREEDRSPGRYLIVLGRLRAGVTAAAAAGEMRRIAAELADEWEYDRGWSANAVPLHDELVGPTRRQALLVLLGAVGVLLLLACINVANLLLSRARRRSRELGMRAALGAGRSRLARQVLAESAVLGALGGVAGLALGAMGVRALAGLLPSDLPGVATIGLGLPLLAFTGGLTLLTTFLFGTVPALGATRVPPAVVLRADESAGGGRGRGRGALVIGEVALAVLLCVAAGLTLRTFVALRAVDPGFDARRVLALRIALEGAGELDLADGADESRLATLDAILAGIEALPGVERAGLVDSRPLGMDWVATSVHLPDAEPEAGTAPVADVRVVSAGYFPAMGIRLLGGRIFGAEDHGDAPTRVVVNATMARLLWPGADPVGRGVVIHLGGENEAEVVGVAEDILLEGPATPPRSQVYFHHRQRTPRVADLVVRASPGDPTALLPSIRARVAAAAPQVPVYRAASMDASMAGATAENRLTMVLLLAFASTALLLAAVGIYGVMATDVLGRRRELGVRLAMGARPGRVQGLVLGRGIAQASAGILLGVAGALLLTRLMRGILFGVEAADPLTYTCVAAVLLLVALASAWIPARRATRVDPISVLRAD